MECSLEKVSFGNLLNPTHPLSVVISLMGQIICPRFACHFLTFSAMFVLSCDFSSTVLCLERVLLQIYHVYACASVSNTSQKAHYHIFSLNQLYIFASMPSCSPSMTIHQNPRHHCTIISFHHWCGYIGNTQTSKL